MAEWILFHGKICSIVCDDDHDLLRFIDRDHVLHIIPRDDVEMVIKDGSCLYRIPAGKDTVTSFYYDEATEEAKCALVRYLNLL